MSRIKFCFLKQYIQWQSLIIFTDFHNRPFLVFQIVYNSINIHPTTVIGFQLQEGKWVLLLYFRGEKKQISCTLWLRLDQAGDR